MGKKMKIDIQGSANVGYIDIENLCEFLDSFTDDSRMVGTIDVPVAYKDSCDAIVARFPEITIRAAKYIVRFKDPEVVRVLLANGVGSGIGITQDQLSALSNISNWFKNTNITTFEELANTQVTRITDNCFANCKNFTFNHAFDNIVSIGTYAIDGLEKQEVYYLPKVEQMGIISTSGTVPRIAVFLPNVINNSCYYWNNNNEAILDVGKKCVKLENCNHTRIAIMRAPNPPSANVGVGGIQFTYKENIDNYKAVSGFSNIHPIGDTEEDKTWSTTMLRIAREYADKYNPSFDIENADYSRPYIDYDIFGVDKSKAPYVLFDDPEVERVLLANNIGSDGVITKVEAAAKNIPNNAFKDNTSIKYFDELKFFGDTIGAAAFQGCLGLVSVDVSNVTVVNESSFSNCTNLKKLDFVNPISVRNYSFRNFTGTIRIHIKELNDYNDAFLGYWNTEKAVKNEFVAAVDSCSISSLYIRCSNLVDVCNGCPQLNFAGVNYTGKNPRYTIIRDITPKDGQQFKGTAFVPSESLSLYKNQSPFKESSLVFAIGGSEWQQAMQTLAMEEGYTKPESVSWSDPYIDYDIFVVTRPE